MYHVEKRKAEKRLKFPSLSQPSILEELSRFMSFMRIELN